MRRVDRIAVLLCGLLLVTASESRKGGGRGRRAKAVEELEDFSKLDPHAGVSNPCTTAGQSNCCGDGKCQDPETCHERENLRYHNRDQLTNPTRPV